ncbi:hypothetical protein GLU26_00570 [Nanohaloarchaea archaeon]|nr:hypothetical protein [Candidatus Nanohaloarchaea archaeon]
MSFMLENFEITDVFITEENFCLIRNDFKEAFREKALKNITEEEKENFSNEDFDEHLEMCREAAKKGEEIATTFDSIESWVSYAPGSIGALSGLSMKIMSAIFEEGSKLKLEIFEQLRF